MKFAFYVSNMYVIKLIMYPSSTLHWSVNMLNGCLFPFEQSSPKGTATTEAVHVNTNYCFTFIICFFAAYTHIHPITSSWHSSEPSEQSQLQWHSLKRKRFQQQSLSLRAIISIARRWSVSANGKKCNFAKSERSCFSSSSNWTSASPGWCK